MSFMRCSLKNKSLTKHKKNVDNYSSTFQVLGHTFHKKQVTSTYNVNVCMFCLWIPSATKLWNVL